MFSRILKAIADVFTGRSMDHQMQEYVESHNPQSTADVERLQAKFWRSRIRSHGYHI
jgi:predicted RNA binding protein with dsRBD fold (UPF0201 family)